MIPEQCYLFLASHIVRMEGLPNHLLSNCSLLSHEGKHANHHLFNCYWCGHILGCSNCMCGRKVEMIEIGRTDIALHKNQSWEITKSRSHKHNYKPGMYGNSVAGNVNRSTMTTPTGIGGRRIRIKFICGECIWSWQMVYKFDYCYHCTYSTHTHTHTETHTTHTHTHTCTHHTKTCSTCTHTYTHTHTHTHTHTQTHTHTCTCMNSQRTTCPLKIGLVYGPLLWPGPYYGHLLYLALSEYAAIPLFLHMCSNAKCMKKTGHLHFLISKKYRLKLLAANMSWRYLHNSILVIASRITSFCIYKYYLSL